MPYIPADTTAEAHAVQVAAWRKMTPQQRVALACELSDNVRQIAAEGVRRRHPDYSDDEVRLAVIRLTLGEKLFREAYPGVDVRP
ncbi:MAG: hypothetical protein IIA67_04060 [Planctomycetes bacterium]|nr:hypothetical protein [Planctomycetota bacterium]